MYRLLNKIKRVLRTQKSFLCVFILTGYSWTLSQHNEDDDRDIVCYTRLSLYCTIYNLMLNEQTDKCVHKYVRIFLSFSWFQLIVAIELSQSILIKSIYKGFKRFEPMLWLKEWWLFMPFDPLPLSLTNSTVIPIEKNKCMTYIAIKIFADDSLLFDNCLAAMCSFEDIPFDI